MKAYILVIYVELIFEILQRGVPFDYTKELISWNIGGKKEHSTVIISSVKT